jgi:hypothetical protein
LLAASTEVHQFPISIHAELKLIEEVKKGNLVLIYNLETRTMTYETVLRMRRYIIVDEDLYDIYYPQVSLTTSFLVTHRGSEAYLWAVNTIEVSSTIP